MKIICIGRNYADHIREFDNGEVSRNPIWFLKPDTALLRNNDPFYIPSFSNRLDYETELVVRIDRVGKCIDYRFAPRYYDAVTLGIDFTARDLQREAIANGRPWCESKGFDRSAAVAPKWISLSERGLKIDDLHFSMSLNGEVRQQGYSGDMLFSVDRIIAYLSEFVTLRMGDLIYTGTPAGVSEVHKGDRIEASLEGEKMFDFDIK